ncbi:MAG: glycosyltransferase [Alphaproteobacteria bacterium]|nr:glycosyltransferase [Alphaproteobacteria bacterium]
MINDNSQVAASASPRLSVIISCYNYEAFLGAAIDSVLSQGVPVELIVVDNGSTDGSRSVLLRYANAIIPVLLDSNRGQGGGLNAGYERASGDLVLFLDADDFLLPGAVRSILDNHRTDVGVYHYRMRYADEEGKLSGLHPPAELPLAEGDISHQLRFNGRYITTVTSGLVFSREALQRVMPIPEAEFQMGADGYLVATVPLHAASASFDAEVSAYRLHARQFTRARRDFGRRSRWRMEHDLQRYEAIRSHAGRLGLPVSDRLGDRDLDHLQERLVSLTFDPAAHPVPGDSLSELRRLARAIDTPGMSMRAQIAQRVWWEAITRLPSGLRKTLLLWKIDPPSRPTWLKSVARALRNRMGVAFR